MADSINRITPITVGPEPVAAHREHDRNGHAGAEERERERERQERAPAPTEQAEEEGAPKDQLKGNRLDISV